MKSISHLSVNQVDYFDRSNYFLEVNPPVWIVRVEMFENDIKRPINILGLQIMPRISTDPVAAHASNYDDAPDLTPTALRNLQEWYSQNIRFVSICWDWLDSYRDAGNPDCTSQTL